MENCYTEDSDFAAFWPGTTSFQRPPGSNNSSAGPNGAKYESQDADLLTLVSYTIFSLCSRDYGTFLYLPNHPHCLTPRESCAFIPSLQREGNGHRDSSWNVTGLDWSLLSSNQTTAPSLCQTSSQKLHGKQKEIPPFLSLKIKQNI